MKPHCVLLTPPSPAIRHHYHRKTLPPHDLQRARSGWVNLGEHTLGLNLWRLLAIEELLSDCVQLALMIQNEQYLLLILF